MTSRNLCGPPASSLCGELDLLGATPEELAAVAYSCDAEWPCNDACIRDYSRTCPSGWSEFSGACTAPAAYKLLGTGCSPVLSTESFSSLDKARWAARCKVEWP